MLCKLLLSFTLVLSGCATAQFTTADVEYFQPPIVTQTAPERPLNSYNVYNNTVKVNLAPMQAIVPAYTLRIAPPLFLYTEDMALVH
jgi:hypothetical protein